MIYISYVYYFLWFSKKESDIDDTLHLFEKDGPNHNWEMNIGCSFEEYLGIQIYQVTEGGHRLTQEGLITKVLEAEVIQDRNSQNTPTTSKFLLGKD